jgi:hypothetical protein
MKSPEPKNETKIYVTFPYVGICAKFVNKLFRHIKLKTFERNDSTVKTTQK